MGIVLVKEKTSLGYLTESQVSDRNKRSSVLASQYKKTPCKRKNGKSNVRECRKEYTEKRMSRVQNGIFILYLQDNSVVLETIPYTSSTGVKGDRVSMPYAKYTIGVVTDQGFVRSSLIDFKVLSEGLGLTFNSLLNRVNSFADRMIGDRKTYADRGDLSAKIVRINKS